MSEPIEHQEPDYGEWFDIPHPELHIQARQVFPKPAVMGHVDVVQDGEVVQRIPIGWDGQPIEEQP